MSKTKIEKWSMTQRRCRGLLVCPSHQLLPTDWMLFFQLFFLLSSTICAGKSQDGRVKSRHNVGVVATLDVMTKLMERAVLTAALTSSHWWRRSAAFPSTVKNRQTDAEWESNVFAWKTCSTGAFWSSHVGFSCLFFHICKSVAVKIFWLKPWMSNITRLSNTPCQEHSLTCSTCHPLC